MSSMDLELPGQTGTLPDLRLLGAAGPLTQVAGCRDLELARQVR